MESGTVSFRGTSPNSGHAKFGEAEFGRSEA